MRLFGHFFIEKVNILFFLFMSPLLYNIRRIEYFRRFCGIFGHKNSDSGLSGNKNFNYIVGVSRTRSNCVGESRIIGARCWKATPISGKMAFECREDHFSEYAPYFQDLARQARKSFCGAKSK